jgi:O-antigen biosynthesis protein WbqV
MRKYIRPLLNLLYDGLASGVAFILALALRFDFQIPTELAYIQGYAVSYAAISIVVFGYFKLHRGLWRYTSSIELVKIAQAVGASLMLISVTMFLITRLENFPRSVFLILPLLHIAVTAGPRIMARLLREKANSLKGAKDKVFTDALVIGAGNNADLFLREVTRQVNREFNIHGLLDNDLSKIGREIQGISVLGTVTDLGDVIEKLAKKKIHISTLILAEGALSSMEDMLNVVRAKGLVVKRIPSISSLESGESATALKAVQIEDLLGRDTVSLDYKKIENLVKGKRILVTGAGGSIGSEMCKQIAARNPEKLYILENSELALYKIDMLLSGQFADLSTQTLLADVQDKQTLDDLLACFPVDIIFHAAAYKHVPMVESNPVAGIVNNLFGTKNVADLARKHNIERMVVISTDKAVNPTNVMGATKRAAEMYCQNLPTDKTKFVTVRFGNVLGSTGSVIPLFTKQIQARKPLTVTHKDATRYFMTIPEAAQLTLQAGAMGDGGEVFMLDMGKPVKIYDMAEEMIRLSGLEPHIDIPIKEIGLRPGEKLFEELWYDGEDMTQTEGDKIFLVKSQKLSLDKLAKKMEKLYTLCQKHDSFEAVKQLKDIVAEYEPADTSPFAKLANSTKEKKAK